MNRKLPALMAIVMIAGGGLVACDKAQDNAPATVTVTQPAADTTAEESADASIEPSDSAAPSEGSGMSSPMSAEASESAAANEAIRILEIEVSSNNTVGQNLLQLDSYGASFSVKWRSKGEDGDLQSSDCGVVVDVTGPAGYDERRRSPSCTSSASLTRIKVAGVYTVKVAVTPPGATTATTEKMTFKVVGAGD